MGKKQLVITTYATTKGRKEIEKSKEFTYTDKMKPYNVAM